MACRIVILNGVVRVGSTEKVTVEERFERGEGRGPWKYLGEERNELVQRTWGRGEPGTREGDWGGQWGLNDRGQW